MNQFDHIPDWIIGHWGDDFSPDREFIVHTVEPRFIAEIFLETDDIPITGVQYHSDSGEVLANVEFWDPPPTDPEVAELFRVACLVIVADSQREPIDDED